MQGWQDRFTFVNSILDLYSKLPASTPARLYLSTGRHGMPRNENQGARQLDLTRSWFDRQLKTRGEAMELGPRVLVASIPAPVDP